jgi:hypothetical protein
MNLLAPAVPPLFAANHGWVMRPGAEGRATLLGASLLAAD